MDERPSDRTRCARRNADLHPVSDVVSSVAPVYENRTLLAAARATDVARAFEAARGATLTDVSRGREPVLGRTLSNLGCPEVDPGPPSADLISVLDDVVRIIEIKGRGSSGPITIIERELGTFRAAGEWSWLYVVWNTTQPGPFQLFLVRDPARLPWVKTQPWTKEPGPFRGARHEAKFECPSWDIERLGDEVSLNGLDLPEK